jgi:hypothetical protein
MAILKPKVSHMLLHLTAEKGLVRAAHCTDAEVPISIARAMLFL